MLIIEGKFRDKIQYGSPVYHWDGEMSEIGAISVPDYIEFNADRFRKKFLDFVHDIGEQNLNGYKVNDQLLKYKGYSLWWMSTIVEKNLVKTPAISDCIKMLALEELLVLERPKLLKVYATNQAVIRSIKYLAGQLNIKIVVHRYKSGQSLTERIKQRIPSLLKGLIYLTKQYRSYSSMYKQRNVDWHTGEQQLFIFSQFVNFDLPADQKSSIYSRYWEILPTFLNQRGIKMTFLNQFHFSKQVQNVKEGIDLLMRINHTSASHGEIHHFVPDFLNIKSIVRVLFFYISVHLKRFKIIRVTAIFKPKNSFVCLWHLLRNDWRNSMLGTVLLENLLFIEAIEHYFQKLPKQNLGLYLQENNGWERAFVLAWKKYQQAELIGVAHTVIRYWDLRYYEHDSAFSSRISTSKIPVPDYIAVNGPVAETMLLNAGYDPKAIIRVEALRYLSASVYKAPLATKRPQNEINVLVCGDIDIASTTEMLHSLKSFLDRNAKRNNDSNFKFTYKSHPINELDLSVFGLDQIEVSSSMISDIIRDFDIAIVTDSTTAGVEAYMAGLDVIVFTYTKRLNFSPLKNVKNVHFASNAKQLADCLKAVSGPSTLSDREVFFWNDNELPKWNQLFSKHYNYN